MSLLCLLQFSHSQSTEDESEAMFIQLRDCLHIFEVSGLDHWMRMEEESEEGPHTIQMKGCLQCKTPIRRSLRYGNIVKTRAKEIEEVKDACLKKNTALSQRLMK